MKTYADLKHCFLYRLYFNSFYTVPSLFPFFLYRRCFHSFCTIAVATFYPAAWDWSYPVANSNLLVCWCQKQTNFHVLGSVSCSKQSNRFAYPHLPPPSTRGKNVCVFLNWIGRRRIWRIIVSIDGAEFDELSSTLKLSAPNLTKCRQHRNCRRRIWRIIVSFEMVGVESDEISSALTAPNLTNCRQQWNCRCRIWRIVVSIEIVGADFDELSSALKLTAPNLTNCRQHWNCRRGYLGELGPF